MFNLSRDDNESNFVPIPSKSPSNVVTKKQLLKVAISSQSPTKTQKEEMTDNTQRRAPMI